MTQKEVNLAIQVAEFVLDDKLGDYEIKVIEKGELIELYVVNHNIEFIELPYRYIRKDMDETAKARSIYELIDLIIENRLYWLEKDKTFFEDLKESIEEQNFESKKENDNQKIHAGRIILLILGAYPLQEKLPFVSLFMCATAVLITFTKINNKIKQEKK